MLWDGFNPRETLVQGEWILHTWRGDSSALLVTPAEKISVSQTDAIVDEGEEFGGNPAKR